MRLTSEDRRWRSIISPVFPDGWVLVAETREPSLAQTESVAAYNIHTGETRVGMAEGHVDATDPWLVELLERHREWISTLTDKRAHEMLRWGGGMTSDGGAVDMPSIYDFGMRQLIEDAESIVRFKQFQQMTTQRNFMFRGYAGMTNAAPKKHRHPCCRRAKYPLYLVEFVPGRCKHGARERDGHRDG